MKVYSELDTERGNGNGAVSPQSYISVDLKIGKDYSLLLLQTFLYTVQLSKSTIRRCSLK